VNKLVVTADGSATFFNEAIGEHYHSKHGAWQESKHVFIEAGLSHVLQNTDKKEIALFEMGFGTGLNFLLSANLIQNKPVKLHYTGIEAYPLSLTDIQSTAYHAYVTPEVWERYLTNYEQAFVAPQLVLPNCSLAILHQQIQGYTCHEVYDLIYLDSFSVQHQPELWSDEMIAKFAAMLKPGACLVTYAITGKLKRALQANHCQIEKLPGAPGKREMLRAIKKYT